MSVKSKSVHSQSHDGSRSNNSYGSDHSQEEPNASRYKRSVIRPPVQFYWNRIMSFNSLESPLFQMHAISQDQQLLDGQMEALEIRPDPHWQPHFNPYAFEKKHKPLLVSTYQLSNEQLADHGKQISEMRTSIIKKAQKLAAQNRFLRQTDGPEEKILEIKLRRQFTLKKEKPQNTEFGA